MVFQTATLNIATNMYMYMYITLYKPHMLTENSRWKQRWVPLRIAELEGQSGLLRGSPREGEGEGRGGEGRGGEGRGGEGRGGEGRGGEGRGGGRGREK